ncbi:MAG: multiheme c-type cytochrome, partial [Pirellulales bacterium]
MRTFFLLAAAVTLAVVAIVFAFRASEEERSRYQTTAAEAPRFLSGRVFSGTSPLAGARVRIQGHSEFVHADAEGRFTLREPPDAEGVITAAKEGYLIAGLPAATKPLDLRLTALPAADCERYQWVDPEPNAEHAGACGNCHPGIYDEWRESAHARSAVNRRLRNLLDGSDWQGNVGHGWSLAGEYPEGVAVCSSCHVPSLDETADDFDLRRASGVAAKGVHCDFCHKIRATATDTAGLTHGRFGYELLRPSQGQIFFGPLDDVHRGEDVYSPLEQESRFCAACHEGTLFGVPVYTTWSEWLASPAAREGRQCQSCHMAPSGMMTNIAPSSGGLERDPATLASHALLPGGRETMLRHAVALSIGDVRGEDSIELTVTLEAMQIGHRMPTGFIDRHLVLVMEPFGPGGEPLQPLDGPRLPEAAGEKLVGKAGHIFAKLLTDTAGHAPAPFWRAGVSLTDTRLLPDKAES